LRGNFKQWLQYNTFILLTTHYARNQNQLSFYSQFMEPLVTSQFDEK